MAYDEGYGLCCLFFGVDLLSIFQESISIVAEILVITLYGDRIQIWR